MRFASGYLLFALLLLPLIWWRWFQRRPFAALRFSSLAPLQRQQRGFGVRARHVVPALRTLAVALLIVCLARPEKGNEQTRIYAEGIAIQMVVDLSGSMESNLESRGLRTRASGSVGSTRSSESSVSSLRATGRTWAAGPTTSSG